MYALLQGVVCALKMKGVGEKAERGIEKEMSFTPSSPCCHSNFRYTKVPKMLLWSYGIMGTSLNWFSLRMSIAPLSCFIIQQSHAMIYLHHTFVPNPIVKKGTQGVYHPIRIFLYSNQMKLEIQLGIADFKDLLYHWMDSRYILWKKKLHI